MFRCNHHHQGAHYSVTVTLARSNNALPDDGDCTETCRSCFDVNFNVNFKTVFKTVHLCISWWIKNFDNIIISRCTVCVRKKTFVNIQEEDHYIYIYIPHNRFYITPIWFEHNTIPNDGIVLTVGQWAVTYSKVPTSIAAVFPGNLFLCYSILLLPLNTTILTIVTCTVNQYTLGYMFRPV
jgi:hypothetical protein